MQGGRSLLALVVLSTFSLAAQAVEGNADAARDKMLSRIPLRRAARPEEMAGPATFLCSDAASYVTGHVLVADGGERAR